MARPKKYHTDEERKAAKKAKDAKWRAANPDYMKSWKAANPEYLKNWQAANPNYERDWKAKNPGRAAARFAKYRAAKRDRTPQWLTADDFAAIREAYKQAADLTILTGIIHEVDHVVPLQGKTVCGLHVPWNLRVIPWNENRSKNNKLVESLI